MTVRQPFDERCRTVRNGVNDNRVDLAIRLVRDVSGKQFRIVMNTLGTLNRVPAAGISPADNAVEPEGVASRSTTTRPWACG